MILTYEKLQEMGACRDACRRYLEVQPTSDRELFDWCYDNYERDWAQWLLIVDPTLITECDRSRLASWEWEELVTEHPDQIEPYCDWSLFHSWNWRRVLHQCSQFAKYCDWDKLGGNNLYLLLCDHPEYKDRCDLSKLSAAERRSLETLGVL